ncbi:zinc-binding metallopeptidase family protein [Actibacterium sp. D379-3]
MRRYHCPSCQQGIYFDNTACLSCGAELGFDPSVGFVLLNGDTARACANRAIIGCNWVAAGPDGRCLSCAHTAILPNLSVGGNAEKWARLEQAKRAVILMLDRLGLPLADAAGAPAPVFEFKADPPGPNAPRVLTGHENGTITLNIVEADDAERARIREEMHEPYRTLPGHFRHEVAHHYWDVLTDHDPRRRDTLRAVFGDDRQDYGASLAAHYAEGPPDDWAERYISAYASSHPWEDFAETWAHVLHVLDGLETAQAFGLIAGAGLPEGGLRAMAAVPMEQLARAWIDLSIALNAVNQAMGHDTFYPFVLSPAIIEKMETVRTLIVEGGQKAP